MIGTRLSQPVIILLQYLFAPPSPFLVGPTARPVRNIRNEVPSENATPGVLPLQDLFKSTTQHITLKYIFVFFVLINSNEFII